MRANFAVLNQLRKQRAQEQRPPGKRKSAFGRLHGAVRGQLHGSREQQDEQGKEWAGQQQQQEWGAASGNARHLYSDGRKQSRQPGKAEGAGQRVAPAAPKSEAERRLESYAKPTLKKKHLGEWGQQQRQGGRQRADSGAGRKQQRQRQEDGRDLDQQHR